MRSVAVTEEGNELGVRVCEWHGDWVISSTRAFLTRAQAKALRNQIDWWLGAVVGEEGVEKAEAIAFKNNNTNTVQMVVHAAITDNTASINTLKSSIKAPYPAAYTRPHKSAQKPTASPRTKPLSCHLFLRQP